MMFPCICPPKGDEVRHLDGDRIDLRPTLDFRAATTVRNAIAMVYAEDPGAGVPDILAALTEHYLLLGIESWSVLDEKGKPVPVSKPAIREYLLSKPMTAMAVGDAADALYSESVMLPLLVQASTSSPPTPSNGSTSPTNGSQPRPPTPSRRSSTTTSRTAAIVPISRSRGGDSRSSPNSATVELSAG